VRQRPSFGIPILMRQHGVDGLSPYLVASPTRTSLMISGLGCELQQLIAAA
jgi:hypothetical protein